jgi:hypothetical protein
MNKNELEKFIEQNLTIRAISKKTNKSASTIKYWLKKYNLSTVHIKKAICKFCGECDPKNLMKQGGGQFCKSRCKKCQNIYSINRFRDNKKKAVEYKGGKCILCGYNKCMRSLSFHHRDPKLKDINWNKMKNWKFEKTIKELDKCDLLCSNCHGEIHEKMLMEDIGIEPI